MTYRWKNSVLEDIKSKCFTGYSFKIINKELLNTIDLEDDIKKYKHIYISNSRFEEEVTFDNYEFHGHIIFENVVFDKGVSFKKCIFHGDCIFVNIKFSNESKNKKLFLKSKVKGQCFVLINTTNTPRLDGAIFSNCSKVILEDLKFNKVDYEYAKFIYRIARNQASVIGDYERVGHYYYLERYYGGKILKQESFNNKKEYLNHKFFDLLSKYTIGYGEKPWNIFIISFCIISVFAILYMFTGIRNIDGTIISINFDNEYTLKQFTRDYIDCWYFSMATFSTVGYGDMIVITIIGKILSSIEVFMGITMGASWASVIIKKMSR
ncbi:MAG: potassium channel family protein [Paraclostridium sp.]